MNTTYVQEVHRYGGPDPFKDSTGQRSNLSHADDVSPHLVRTDGKGNVVATPTVWRKDCWLRPERFCRGRVGSKPWRDESGRTRPGATQCDTCRHLSPGTFESCARIVDERIESSPTVKAAAHKWLDACGNDFGPACFLGARLKLWNDFLQAIIEHGGWQNKNDDQVKLEALRRKGEKGLRRRATGLRRSTA